MNVPLTIAAVVFLVAYSWQVIGNPRGDLALGIDTVMWLTWGVFLVDYVVRLVLAESRGRWFVQHLFDLAVVVLPMLRPLRLLRVVTILDVLQRTAGRAFRTRVIVYVVAAAVLLIYVAGLAALDAERGRGGAITTIGESLWWALTTITTVGYGDVVPETLTGRLVAAGLMIGGIALIGVVTATLASWIVERVQTIEEQRESTRADLDLVYAELVAIRAELAEDRRLRAELEGRTSPTTTAPGSDGLQRI